MDRGDRPGGPDRGHGCWDGSRDGTSARASLRIQDGCGSIQSRSSRACRAVGRLCRVGPSPSVSKNCRNNRLQEGFELDVGHRKAFQGALGSVAQFKPGPGQSCEHGVDMEVAAGPTRARQAASPRCCLALWNRSWSTGRPAVARAPAPGPSHYWRDCAHAGASSLSRGANR